MFIANIFTQKNVTNIKAEQAATLIPAATFTGTLPKFLEQFDPAFPKPDLILIDAKSLFTLSTHDKANGHYAAHLSEMPHLVFDDTIIRTGGYYTKLAGQKLNILRLMELNDARDARKLVETFRAFTKAHEKTREYNHRRSDPVIVNGYVFDLYAPAVPRNRR